MRDDTGFCTELNSGNEGGELFAIWTKTLTPQNGRASSPGSHAKTGQDSLASSSKVELASSSKATSSNLDLASSKADLASSNLDSTAKPRRSLDKEVPRAR